ncbi:UDP-glucose 4-epimerase GalE [Pseudalkalibacillus sp. SCS-8]|uniref:UDP-glucose 4-epimerase GalE n=1 Tax=Pseudalkalibacillus nanhaiensis TaxID=3115291 RepID=UPI0032DAE099
MLVLVTGGTGYIGSHTCIELINEGFEVVILDNLSNSSFEVIHRIKEITGKKPHFIHGDLLDEKELQKVFNVYDIEAVLHFAGLKAVGESVHFPLRYYHNNVTGTLNLSKAMQETGTKKMVFSSSATVYSLHGTPPFNEETPLGAMNPYGRTKQMVEEMMHDLYHADPEWSISLLRYFNPIGAHPSGLIGEDPQGLPNNLIPYITQVCVGKLPYLNIYGNDYDTHDGTGVRDYIHVCDLARGHVLALKDLYNKRGVSTYNLGTGRGYSVMEIVETFERITGNRIPYRFTERRPGDIHVCLADPNKAALELGWQAEKDLTEMCKDTWKWQKNNPDGYSTAKKVVVTS